MDNRDPVVMQAIANVIGAQTIDMGCLGPQPGNTQAIYDEIRRLDKAGLDEAEDRRRAEVEAQQKKDASVPPNLTTTIAAGHRSIEPTTSVGEEIPHTKEFEAVGAPTASKTLHVGAGQIAIPERAASGL
jgi:hypothetical protein